jgi:serine/threonine protein kinase
MRDEMADCDSGISAKQLQKQSRQVSCSYCARVHKKCDGQIPCSFCAKRMRDYPNETFVCHYPTEHGNLDVTMLCTIGKIHTKMLLVESGKKTSEGTPKKKNEERDRKEVAKQAVRTLDQYVKSVIPAATTELIGFGGSGFVACVRDETSERVWAFKGSLRWGNLAKLTLLREYMMLCRAQVHHSVVPLLSDNTWCAPGGLLHNGTETYLLLKYLDNAQYTNSHTFWNKPTRILEEVCEFAESIMKAVQFLESMGMRHNDLKWDNVMICMVRPIHAILIDLGGAGVCTTPSPGEHIFARTVPVVDKTLVSKAFNSALQLDAGVDGLDVERLHEFVHKASQELSVKATGGRGTGGFRFVPFEYDRRADKEEPFSGDCFAVGLMLAVCLSGGTLMDVWSLIRRSSNVRVQCTDKGDMQMFEAHRREEAWMVFLHVLYKTHTDAQCTNLVADYMAAHVQTWGGKTTVVKEDNSKGVKKRKTTAQVTTSQLNSVWELCGKLMWGKTSCDCAVKQFQWR